MPTVSAALGCSPTARVRRPQRERNSRTWKITTSTMTDMAIGPWLRNIARTQPTTGRSVTAFGGKNALKLPAPSGDPLAMSVLR